MSDFVEQEFASLELGDERRSKRLRRVLQRLLDSPMRSIQSACRGWAETMAAYRLLNNPCVEMGKIFAPHRKALIARAKPHSCIAVVQDTTELDYTRKKHMEGAGPLNSVNRRGFLVHTQFVVTPERVPLGVLDTHIFAREDSELGKQKPKYQPIEQKESYRWLEGYQQACDLAAQVPEAEVFSVSDREGDIYEIFDRQDGLKNQGAPTAHWLVRANKDRALLDESGKECLPRTLFEEAEGGKVLGSIEFEIKTQEQARRVEGGSKVKTTRRARRVRQRLKVAKVNPRPPKRVGVKLAQVSFWVILAEEIDCPKDQEPIRWILLTSKQISNFEDAQKILKLYLARWEIEVFHRVLKSGCQVEEIQLKDKQAVFSCLALYMIVAWRILYMMHLGRQCPDLPCSVVFEEAEWKSALAIAHRARKEIAQGFQEPSLGEMIQIVAKFGGHLGRRGDHPPGAQTLWQGLSRIRDFAIAWLTLGSPDI